MRVPPRRPPRRGSRRPPGGTGGERGSTLHEEGPIRTTGIVLLTFFLAAAAAVGGYGLLIAATRGPLPTSPPAPHVDLPPEIPEPERLPRLTPAQPASVGTGQEEPELAAATVIVTGAERDDPAGVAVLDSRGAPLGWQPLSAGEDGPEGLRLTFSDIPAGDHFAALAASPDRARYSYRARVALLVAPGEEVAPPGIDARTQDVTVDTRMEGRPPDALPPVFRLSRVDDPHWHPGTRSGGVLEDPMTVPSADGTLRLRGLGPGRYALQPLDGDYRPFELTVPGPARLTARFTR